MGTLYKFFMKKTIVIFLTIFSWSLSLKVCAQSIVAQVNSNSVYVGVPFQFEIIISGSVSSAYQPNFRDLDIASGPNQTWSVKYINGVRSDSTRISYELVAQNEGKYSIGPAVAVVDGKRIETAPVAILCNPISEQNYQLHSKDHDVYTTKKGTYQIMFNKKVWTSRSHEDWEFFIKDTFELISAYFSELEYILIEKNMDRMIRSQFSSEHEIKSVKIQKKNINSLQVDYFTCIVTFRDREYTYQGFYYTHPIRGTVTFQASGVSTTVVALQRFIDELFAGFSSK
jgi:hypothetical protein